jgi:hypothetical protein
MAFCLGVSLAFRIVVCERGGRPARLWQTVDRGALITRHAWRSVVNAFIGEIEGFPY